MRCYCSICRKTAGGGGYAINLGADYASLTVEGEEHLSIYRARLESGEASTGQRHFCRHCGSALWLYDPTWPELVHPHASAIDTPLPLPPEHVHMMLGSRAPGWRSRASRMIAASTTIRMNPWPTGTGATA